MSFFRKLFGLGPKEGKGGNGASGEWSGNGGKPVEAVEHEGYTIIATPIKEGGQYRLCGTISKEIDGEPHEHRLIRADLFSSPDECTQFTVRKAKQVIKEQGDAMFGDVYRG